MKKSTTLLPSGLVTFMFTDIVGSTELKNKVAGESSSDRVKHFRELIKEPHDRIVEAKVAVRGGIIVKSTGDGFFIVFSDVEKAVLCAVEIQDALKAAAIAIPGGQLQIRIGLDSGYAEPEAGDYTSSAADKASRIQSSAQPGQVCLSAETNGLVRGKIRNISTHSAGILPMKGLDDQEVFVVSRGVQIKSGLPEQVRSKPKRDSIIQQPFVVIGDPDEERFTWFKKLLRDVFEIGAVQFRTFEELKEFLKTETQQNLVFLSDDLPFSKTKGADPNLNFVRLEALDIYVDYVCIVTKEDDPDLGGVDRLPHHVHIRRFPPTEKDTEKVLNELGSLGSRLARLVDLSEIVKITGWDKTNRTLHRQIRSLADKHELDEGEDTLLRLIRKCVDCRKASKIEIKQLGQGKSGASVFRLEVHAAGEIKSYVLKVSDAIWKLRSEVSGHLEAQKHTQLPEYKQHVAALRKPLIPLRSPASDDQVIDQFIVNTGQWYAIHCDFLGEDTFGKFIDLETALTAAPVVLRQKTNDAIRVYALTSTEPTEVLAHRLKLFGATLDSLREIWYGRAGLGRRSCKQIWQMEDADDDQFCLFPPYQLTQRVKGRVQDFLDDRDAVIGARLFPKWNEHKDLVLSLVSEATEGPRWVNDSIPFTLSPVHGDLNANNVLLWLEHEKYPFVIDLPSYQKDGHTLQDFARLEVEIKLVLLDRQEESPLDILPAYDYSPSQVRLWMDMENRLMADGALNEAKLGRPRWRQAWNAPGYQENVDLSYRLVMLLRQKASDIQQQKLDFHEAVPFTDEYLPALLYHTVRAISYPSLSFVKRLFAVHSAGSIIKRLNESWLAPRQCSDPILPNLDTRDQP